MGLWERGFRNRSRRTKKRWRTVDEWKSGPSPSRSTPRTSENEKNGKEERVNRDAVSVVPAAHTHKNLGGKKGRGRDTKFKG